VDLVYPSWEQVKKAILSLDGERRTMVTLSDRQGGDSSMLISGQWNGRFMVSATPNNYDFFSLIDRDRSNKKITLFVGGQNGDYEECRCVPLEWTLEAGEFYFETGELKPSMNWVSEFDDR
jgi:hypothetical protein